MKSPQSLFKTYERQKNSNLKRDMSSGSAVVSNELSELRKSMDRLDKVLLLDSAHSPSN